LPPRLELGPSVSIYQDAEDVRVAGPARVLLGAYEGASSAIHAPTEINYLALRLAPGERWQYQPPTGHDVLWIAVGKGVVRVPDPVRRGELAIFAPGQEAVDFVAEAEAEFMLGSAVPHLTTSSPATIRSTLAQALWQRASSAFARYARNSCARGGCRRSSRRSVH
jgi:redox-sensitive bicupin YhaK (pirin superfamily)